MNAIERRPRRVYGWKVEGYYVPQYGFEEVYASTEYRDARDRLKEYRENEPQYAHRLKRTWWTES
jgi:hypothetical protein